MPIPMYRNLANIGIVNKFSEQFHNMDLTPIKPKGRGDTLYWFYNVGGYHTLAFVGKKSIRIHKQFDFHRTWERRYPSVIQRGQKAADTATRKVESMIATGDISGL
jgi:hypothetical protein